MHIKGNSKVCRLLIIQDAKQDAVEAIYAVGGKPFLITQKGNAVIGPVQNAVTVNDQEFIRHLSLRFTS